MLRLTFLRAAAAVALAAALCLVAPARAADPVLSKNVPGDAIVYIGWQGSEALQAKYDKSNLKHIVDASKVPAWIDEKSGWALEQIKKESPEAEAGVKVALSVGAKMWKHPTALYVGPFDMSKVDKDTPPTPRIALICQAGADADALIKEVQPLIDQAKDSPVKLAIKKAGDKIVFTVGEFTPAQQVTLGIFEGAVNMRTVPLTNANEFKAAMAEVDADAALSAYIDMQALAGQLEDLMKKIPEPEAQKYAPLILDAVNLRGMTQIAMSGTFVDKEWVDRSFVGLKGPRKGITVFFDNPPLGDSAFKAIPKDAVAFQIMRLDLGRIFDEVRAGVKKVEPAADKNVDQMLAMVQTMFGVDLQADVLDALGDTWTIYRVPQTAENPIGVVLMISAKDEKKLKETVAKVEDILRDRGMPLPKEKEKIGDSEASVIEIQQLQLAWGVSHGRLIVSTKEGFTTAVEQLSKAKDSILDNPSYVAVRKSLGGGAAVSAEYGEPAKTYPEFAKGIAQLLLVARVAGVEFPDDLLPEPKAIEPFLTPGGGVGWTDDKGYHTNNRSAFPGASILAGQMNGTAAVGAVAASTAILLPSLGRSRELSNRAYSAANLRGIAMSANIWAADHKDDFPEHVAQLVASNQISPKQLVSKRRSTAPAEVTAEELAAAAKDWKKLAEKLEEHSDYVIDFKGQKAWTDSALVIAWEKPEGLKDGINVAFSDGHVEFVRFANLKEIFDTSNRERQNPTVKLPPTEFKDGLPIAPK